MEKVLARFTDGLIFESDFIRRVYERRVGAGLAPTAVITNGLQPSDFGTHEPRADAADFLFVGELRQLKGVDVLLRALAEVKRARPVSAVIVGAGPDREAFERLAEELQLTGARDLSRRRSRRRRPSPVGARSSSRRAPKACPSSCWRRPPPQCR